ncbi:V-type proton ATPase subunit C isoform X2 [Teleopsis dalmanni]|uniref:V-type proton ATPase subunit C isoform X2 n=1 Tax=Teleopsis dalmanni TaxID=139649 RepID=UPI0018CCEF69|nr:V-type proton ATPase subunit C isoform X2 [Teleopsis dalmanni]
MSEYWLISAPGDKTCQQTFDTMNSLTNKQNNLCNNFKFHIPDLKVGTLDQLVGLSDDLGKLDSYVEQITRKVAAYLGEVLEDQRDKLHENLLANNIPDPPDENINSHAELTGKASNLSNSRDTTTTTCSTCHSGASLINFSSNDESDREFDLLSSPACCICDDCAPGTSTSASASASASATATTLLVDECYSHTSSALNAPCTLSVDVVPHVAADNSNSYCSTSAPSTGIINALRSSCKINLKSNSNNNNTCNINNNRLGLNTNSNVSHVHYSNEDSGASASSSQLKSSNSTSDISDTFDWWFHKPKRNSKKSSNRSSFRQLNKNNGLNFTTTHRSSPVSSCCGNSSQGRSSPDTDMGEPPTFPLSPADLSVYITRFQWDMAKYPIKQSLRNIADIISKQIGQIDADLKTKSGAYNNLKGSLQNLEKKQTGSLLTRNLADLVKKEHFVLDSEYLSTLLVIVPKIMANEWLSNYEKITDMIVPRSSSMITQDNDYCLFNVTLFKKVVEEFKLHAREKKFIVRDFVYNEEELAAGKNEMTKLITDKKKQFGPLVRWLKVNFSEAFCALVHVKALRVFVESVLRYGLPVNFQAILIEPNKKSVKRLRDVLNQLYGHLDGASAGGQVGNADNVDIPGLGFGQSDYYPYVFYKLNIDMVETSKI